MPSPEQSRVNEIHAFQAELERLTAEGLVALDAGTLARIQARHDAELGRLARISNVDLTPAAARLSLGMKIATLLGTIALSTAYALFVGDHWGRLGVALQILLVIVPTLLLVIATHVAAHRDPSGYVAALLATVAVIAFHTDLATLGTLYNLVDTRGVLLVGGGLALTLAYGYGLTLPLLAGIGLLLAWAWTLGAIPLGLWWTAGFQTMEPLVLAGAIALAVPAVTRGPARFAPWWRGAGTAAIAFGLLMLAQSGTLSLFGPLPQHRLEFIYRWVGAIVLGGLITWGIRRDQRVVMWVATGGAVLFLLL
ncbi:MAG TPA: hypothetical protein VG692_10645, partial [Gemmatimonadales bacterium]|nr:hypothetical protein [Gemmatimonadales bacterium]